MTNHIHVVAVPEAEQSLERVFRPLHTRYAQRINRAKHRKGHLWQGRFLSSALDEPYLWAAIRYVERNPVRAGMVRRAENYAWSSASAHCGLKGDSVLTKDREWLNQVKSAGDWSKWLAEGDRPEQLEVLRRHVERGLLCGAEAFIRRPAADAARARKPSSEQCCPRPDAVRREGTWVLPEAATWVPSPGRVPPGTFRVMPDGRRRRLRCRSVTT